MQKMKVPTGITDQQIRYKRSKQIYKEHLASLNVDNQYKEMPIRTRNRHKNSYTDTHII